MEKVTYDVPGEFSDEDRWFRFFNKKQILVLAITAAMALFLFKMFSLFGVGWIGLLIGIPFSLVSTLLTIIPMPEENYLRGGGLTMDVILARKVIRKKTRCLYVKGIGGEKNK